MRIGFIRAPLRFWRGRWDTAVARSLDCGRFEHGFARVVCPCCLAEFLVAVSCKGPRALPSCGAKRAAIFAELADAPDAQWVFSMPKMLRPNFLYIAVGSPSKEPGQHLIPSKQPECGRLVLP